ncbi:MAG: hypothetical protein O3C46_05350 [Bacteroidetes bacterium]|nr:hypothetical protein [Bacteroidota bacterium]
MRSLFLLTGLWLGSIFALEAQTFRVPVGFFMGSNLGVGPAISTGGGSWFQWSADVTYAINPKISAGIESSLISLNFLSSSFGFIAKGGYHFPLSTGQIIANAGIGGIFGGPWAGFLLNPDVRYRYELTPFLFAEGGIRMPIVISGGALVGFVPHVGLMYSF